MGKHVGTPSNGGWCMLYTGVHPTPRFAALPWGKHLSRGGSWSRLGRWVMGDGLLAIGYWLLAIGDWLLVIGDWQLVNDNLARVNHTAQGRMDKLVVLADKPKSCLYTPSPL